MPVRFGTGRSRVVLVLAVWLLATIAAMAADEPPVAEKATPATEETPPANDKPAAAGAKPAAALAGNLVRVRPKAERDDSGDLLNDMDLARDVVYQTAADPVPEDQQFQFVDGVLRTPATGMAQLFLPAAVPKNYRLSVTLTRKGPETDPPVGIGGRLEGHSFMAEMRREEATLGLFYGKPITKSLRRSTTPGPPAPRSKAELLVHDGAMVLNHQGGFLEWFAPGSAFSLDAPWAEPDGDKIFLAFPQGQFDIESIRLEPLDQASWADGVMHIVVDPDYAKEITDPRPTVPSDVEAIPHLAALKSTIQTQAQRGNFDELERWADRFRGKDTEIESQFVLELFYDWLSQAYVTPWPGGSFGKIDGYFQAELAFVEAWLNAKPESVTALIVKARVWRDYGWDARGGGFRDTVPQEAWLTFFERLGVAEAALKQAEQLKPRDVCVYSTFVTVGKGLQWNRKKMLRTIEQGLQISKKDYFLIDSMAFDLLPRWGGEAGDLGEFAQNMCDRISGEDGLYVYARIARKTQVAEVRLARNSEDLEAFAGSNGTYLDPKVLLAEFDADRLREACKALRTRTPKGVESLNFECWVCCALDDKPGAAERFSEIVDRVDVDIWGSRDRFDRWHKWCDPSVREPSQFLPPAGSEIISVQAYADGTAMLGFLTDNQTLLSASAASACALKFWDCSEKTLVRQFEPPLHLGRVAGLWLLEPGNMLVPMIDGRKTTLVDYPAPDYKRGGNYPISFEGNPFNLISDNRKSVGLIEKKEASVVSKRAHTFRTFDVHPWKDAGLSPDGRYLLTTGDDLRLYDVTTAGELLAIDAQPIAWSFLCDSS
ncbi:MAG TPA: DUF4034 domain-containing protein, partial [Pirellulales bacterium]|nr:DUF4034 domain-containing protein [Pirellulales bacterium]